MKFKWVAPAQHVERPVPKPFVGSHPSPQMSPPAPAKQPAVVPPPAPVVPGPRIAPVTHGPAATTADIPTLDVDAARAVTHRGTHIQIIAAAGSGKTEVVSQRVASLLADGEAAESIVAFTFTEKAAAELKERIRERVTARMGPEATDQLGRLFVGTIHAYCFRMLQTYVPRYETYTPLDANQLTNFLYQQSRFIGIKALTPTDGTFKSIATFQRGIDVIENELIDVETLPAGDFKVAVESYYSALDRHQFMSFGTQIVRAVEALADPEVHTAVTAPLRHLVVDEYQDVNPAQERLVQLLSKPLGKADVVVVGDDDQAIYQWRGSSVENIVTFADRYTDVEQFTLLTNRRSRPGIIEVANLFASTIPGRIDKQMLPFREADGPSVAMVRDGGSESDAAHEIARQIVDFHSKGLPYRDIAILVRGRAAYPALIDALAKSAIPVQAGGRSGLFAQPEPQVFGATYAWIADVDWSTARFAQRQTITLDRLLDDYCTTFALAPATRVRLADHLMGWKAKALASDFNESLVRDFYTLMELLGVAQWDLSDELTRNRLGTVARFTTVLADYEGVSWRARKDRDNPGEQVGGRSGGVWFYKNLAILMTNYAVGSYDDFAGEDGHLDDAVALGTVHGSKGLEWPVVFLPSLVTTRFPSSRTGRSLDFPTDLLGRFDRQRYEGTDPDERRLFYVAITRARDAVLMSSFSLQSNGKTRGASPYYTEVATAYTKAGTPTSAVGKGSSAEADLTITYSELAAFETCPRSYLLKNELGFMPAIQQELGYGNAVHHTMRVLAERTQATGVAPTAQQVEQLLNSEFFMPYANKVSHREMREKARRLVMRYLTEYSSDLLRTWATERPFELYLDGTVISGRADVIYDNHGGQIGRLAIVDYKTSTRGQIDPLQLQIYTEAGRREGLDVGGAFIQDLGAEKRYDVATDTNSISDAEKQIIATVETLRRRDFEPKPERRKCRQCDVRQVCSAAPKQ
ncbi:ATP-dependent helicase [Mycolicibacterium rufum]|uniref:DNA 3'-5' helicase n=1 Tax=Mycolicibacterium rufum TaxID=318424 RepID=A0ABY3UKR4_9MYCO|nr:ATP-dependent DNA helicase [Mycolicibacterium rufum]KGI66850.1 ATP-dependent DNA helicase [Mycolicibacterium rufum]ULP37668.1 ATP-dependent helicase [Mycolicibacterium rufum]